MLAEQLLSYVSPEERERLSADAGGLESRLAIFVTSAHTPWPDLSLSSHDFLRHVAKHLAGTDLEGLHGPDLFLACACANGDRLAIVAFEKKHARDLDAVLLRMRVEKALWDELRQELRTKLFVQGAIAEYSGRGALKAWLRVVLVRMVLDFQREENRHLSLEDGLTMAFEAPSDNPELEMMKRALGAEFREAFRDVVASLPTRDKNLLHLHFVDGVPIEQIGAIHNVHRTTASRWLASVQHQMLLAIRGALKTRLKVGSETIESVLQLVQSRIELNLETVLRSSGEMPKPAPTKK